MEIGFEMKGVFKARPHPAGESLGVGELKS
jgi:hypothetical protein